MAENPEARTTDREYRMLGRILPQETKFYQMLDELERHARDSARLLKQLIETDDPEKINEADVGIATAKSEAKLVIEVLTEEVCRTLITPFDREDMQEFAIELYNVPKVIEKVKDRMLTHHLKPRNGDFNKFVEIINRQADAMQAVSAELTGRLSTKTINAKVAVLHELEDQGDMVLGQMIVHAFRDFEDTRELILRKDLYEMLEDVIDYYRDAANVALRIILKHS